MGYSTSKPPRVICGPLTGAGKLWQYSSTDPEATVNSSSYFTNGYDLGMRQGDGVMSLDETNLIWSFNTVISAASTAVDLGTGTTIGSSASAD